MRITTSGRDKSASIDGMLSYRTPLGTLEPYTPRADYEPMTLTFQTPEVFNSMLGRRGEPGKNGIIGWSLAASACSRLDDLHLKDNPYADLMLIQIEQDLVDRRAVVAEATSVLQDMARQPEGVELGDWGTREVRVAIDTGNAHARMLALFVLEVDRLFKQLKQARSLGAMKSAKFSSEIRGYRRCVRQALNMPVLFYAKLCDEGEVIEVTRKDFATGSEALTLLRSRLGFDPSKEIMAKTLQPEHVPVLWTQDIVSDASDTHTISNTGEEAITP